MIDLLVVGGGPAGLGTALYAARAGMSVAVVERRSPPIDKACGEGLMPGAVERLRSLGVEPSGRSFAGIRYLDASRSVAARFRTGTGLGVRRTVLSAAMRQRAEDAGVHVAQRSVEGISHDDHSVRAAGIRARYLVAADGLHSPIRRELGLDRPSRRRPRYGLRAHFAVEPWSDTVDVHWSRDSEAYVTPVDSATVGVAILSSVRRPYDRHLADFPRLQERLAGAPAVTAVRGAGPLRQRVAARVAGRVLLVGDAAGYVDAITGEGVALALAEGQTLVQCLLRGQPSTYERAWRTASRRYRVITEGLLAARGTARTAGLVVPLATRFPQLFEAVAHALDGSTVTSADVDLLAAGGAEPRRTADR